VKKIKIHLNKKTKIILWSVLVVLLIALVVLFFVFGTGKKNLADKQEEEVKTEEPEATPEPEVPKVQIIDLDSESRNIAVMINNIRTVWGYQSGLQDAYLVYEMIVEGGYTRLMAIYKDKMPERIGSVRSARPYYLDYALENDALYIHFGGSDQALRDVRTLGIQNINFLYDSGFWRDRSLGLATEHTAFTSMENINQQVSKKGYRTTTKTSPVFHYSAVEVDLSAHGTVIPANRVYIDYSGSRNTSFDYDPVNKVYYRSQNGVAHKDYITGNQYTTKNIITYQVRNYSLDSYGRQALDNIGSGKGYYITNGQAVEITWEKKSRGEKTIYRYMDGTEIELNDGNTYVEIQPLGRTLTIE
jgi:hypothetical protein